MNLYPDSHCGLECPMKQKALTIAGGMATAWKREGYTFENCIHWLVGSREGEELNAMWKEVCDIGRLDFYDGEIYQVIEKGGQSLIVYRDVDRMEKEFL